MAIVDAEELGGEMTEKLAGLFNKKAAPPKSAGTAPPGRKAKALRELGMGRDA